MAPFIPWFLISIPRVLPIQHTLFSSLLCSQTQLSLSLSLAGSFFRLHPATPTQTDAPNFQYYEGIFFLARHKLKFSPANRNYGQTSHAPHLV
ncbi:unnamed protein product [Protopolystoma xenopodis]|uniref:Secreted protein n=1 Tax=Protopolystoma xenopodis TaxID=117903 RepID=A0A3S5BGB3_9PLAT|nr:unnamed protein product [Protopolystoma xenopodis]